MENLLESTAIAIARAHIDAWSRHDWDKTRELLAPDVRVLVTTVYPQWRVAEYIGLENYMIPKIKAAQLIELGSVHVISAIGDETKATILATMRIRLGSDGTMVTLVRSCLYVIDENKRIKEEMDQFFVLP